MSNATKYSEECIEIWKGKLDGDDGLSDLLKVESGQVSLIAKDFVRFQEATGWGLTRGFSKADAAAVFGDFMRKNVPKWQGMHSTGVNHLLNELTFIGLFTRTWDGYHWIYRTTSKVRKNGLRWIMNSTYLFGGGFGFRV